VKRNALLRHLRQHGCYLKREGREHSLWNNPATGAVETVPRHTEIPNRLARKICRNLVEMFPPGLPNFPAQLMGPPLWFLVNSEGLLKWPHT